MEKIIKQNAADAAKEYSCIFGANKNLYRTIPSMQDGLKPGKRRIFYSWWETCGCPTNTKKETLNKLKFSKVTNVAAHAMIYHPHGNIANEEVIYGEGQSWANNICTVVPQGNYGSIRGDKSASGRYGECKMSEYLIDCFFDDFDKYCVPMKESYDGEKMEPEFLPAKYPHALFNPQLSGIGYGLASNIISFNVAEVLKATIKLLKDPDAKILLLPDLPTGANIIDDGSFKELNDTGEGKVIQRASSKIDHQKNIITITSLPLQMDSQQVIHKVIEKKKKGSFDEIIEIMDYTKLDTVDIRFVLKSDANPDKVLKRLFENGTGLKQTAPFSLKLIDNYREYSYSIKGYLLEWIEYRRDIVRSMFSNYLIQTMEKQHMNEVLLFVFNEDNAEETLKICKSASSRKDTIEKLMKKYKITSLQASTIADMKLYHFNKDAYKRFKEEKVELAKEVKRLTASLESEELIDEFIIEQLETGIKKYGRPRLSKIIKDDSEFSRSRVPNTNHLIAISETGYIKKVIMDVKSIGYVGSKNDNFTVIPVNNREDVIIIDSLGLGIRIPVSTFPDMDVDDPGVEIARYFRCSGKVISTMKLPDVKMLKEKNNDICIILITKRGFVKRVKLSEFKGISEPRNSITLNVGDEVVSALFSLEDSENDIIIYTDTGYGVRLPIRDLPIRKRTAKGSRWLKLGENENVSNADIIDASTKTLFYITSTGRMKITQTKYFPSMGKNGELLQLISLGAREKLFRILGIGDKKNDVVRLYYKQNEPIDVEVDSMTMSTRIAKGDKVVRQPRGDSIVSAKVIHNK